MGKVFDLLSKKFMILTSDRYANDKDKKKKAQEVTAPQTELDKIETEIKYPYCCAQKDIYPEVQSVVVNTPKGRKSAFVMKPVTMFIIEKKNKKVFFEEKRFFVTAYTPMLRSKEQRAIIYDDLDYKSLIEAIERAMLDYFADEIINKYVKLQTYLRDKTFEDVYIPETLECLQCYNEEDLPRTYAKLPNSLKVYAERSAVDFVKKYVDAFELELKEKSNFGGNPEITDEVPCVMNSIHFYVFDSRADKKAVMSAVENVMDKNSKVGDGREAGN